MFSADMLSTTVFALCVISQPIEVQYCNWCTLSSPLVMQL